MKKINCVYICCPTVGVSEEELAFARRCCQHAFERNFIPVCPQLYFPQFVKGDHLMDQVFNEYATNELVRVCCEMWVFGPESHEVAEAMQVADEENLPIRYFDLDGNQLRLWCPPKRGKNYSFEMKEEAHHA